MTFSLQIRIVGHSRPNCAANASAESKRIHQRRLAADQESSSIQADRRDEKISALQDRLSGLIGARLRICVSIDLEEVPQYILAR